MIEWSWTIINVVGLAASLYMLREARLDYRAARSEDSSESMMLYVRENRRAQSFRVAYLVLFTLVGIGAVAPDQLVPSWIGEALLLALVSAAALVALDAVLAGRAKRSRLLAESGRDTEQDAREARQDVRQQRQDNRQQVQEKYDREEK